MSMSRVPSVRPSSNHALPAVGAVVLTLVLAACTGSIPGGGPAGGGNGPGGTPAGGGTPGVGTQQPAPANVAAAVAPLRRLTADQYRNTVRDLLGLKDAVSVTALPGDDAIGDRFFSNVSSSLASIDLDHYADAAEALADKAVANLGALVPCDPAAGDAACAQKFIASFGKRAYRRPLAPAEVARLSKLYTAAGTFPEGIRTVISALLQSPKFLYLPEPVPAGAAGKVVGVDSWALASRLSYFLLNTMPDEALFAAVEAGQLTTADQLAKQATRLMTDPRFRETVTSFHDQWLELKQISGTDKDTTVFPAWTPELKAALAEESRRFVDAVMSEDGRLQTLLTSRTSYLSGPLYDLYGVPKPADTTSWQKTELPAAQRMGILTQAGLLAAQAHENRTSFILRGKLVREALLCTDIPPPPPGVVNNDDKLPAGTSARERAAAHRADPKCAICHDLFDPIGFAFENYDAIGRFRTSDGAGAIDAKVQLTATQALDGPVAGPLDLAQRLAGADEVRDCAARQWMRFALGREDSPDDAASLKAAMGAFKDSGGKVPALLLAVARSDAFRYQKVAE
jgi:hypothetical protein